MVERSEDFIRNFVPNSWSSQMFWIEFEGFLIEFSNIIECSFVFISTDLISKFYISIYA